ncbi:MAG TPA: hypothetical protein VK698_00905 [Kofleriaceae bacterium]|nr:hypothetical protein [Kofleriaceae bacterium]
MFRDDYILAMVKQLANFLARMARRRGEGKLEDALDEADRAWSELFEIPRDLCDAVDSSTLAGLLGHPERIRAAAQLFWEEGRIHTARGDAMVAALKYRRALELILEARAAGATEADDAAVLELSRLIPVGDLDARYRDAAK